MLLCKKISTNDLFAIKILKKSDIVLNDHVSLVKAERRILDACRNEHLVRLYFTFETRVRAFQIRC